MKCFSEKKGNTAFMTPANSYSLILALALSWLPSVAIAFGSEGHQVVAHLAEAQLNPKALTEVKRLLALEPGSTLASISTYPDEHRSPATGPWHYVNLPRGTCSYVAERDCPDGKCVVGAIERQIAVLKSNAPDRAKLTALKYLVHFVADIHQPLHAGYSDDKGGNKYQIRFMSKGTNLHALWDSGLIDQIGKDSDALATELMATQMPAEASNLDMVNAALESCQIIRGLGFYPPNRKLRFEYVDSYIPVVKTRLALAGGRLAGILNGVWR
jgi:hypothetical protein